MSSVSSNSRNAIPSVDVASLSEPQLALAMGLVVMFLLFFWAPPFVRRTEDNSLSIPALLGWGIVSGGATFVMGWLGV